MTDTYLPANTAVAVIMTGDALDPETPDGQPNWRVTTFDVVRDGVVLASLQVTPLDIAILPVGTVVEVIGV